VIRLPNGLWTFASAWLITCVVSVTTLQVASDRRLVNEARSLLYAHLSEVLDERLFSDDRGRVNKDFALLPLGKQINEQIHDAISFGPFALHQQCALAVNSIDGLDVAEKHTEGHSVLTVSIKRNQIARRVEASLACDTNYPVLVADCCLFAFVFFGLYHLRPRPLGRWRTQLFEWLRGQGYDANAARMIVMEFQESMLEFDEYQHDVLNLVHDARTKNAREAIVAAIAYKSELTDPLDRLWYQAALHWENTSPDQALSLAKQTDTVVVNLAKSKLTIRGLEIPLRKTALLYYGWYARALQDGDGWIINPASNRPDREQGAKLAEFMYRFNGHAKAISDLEQSGLKATTLDQNRCKIKDEMTATLGQELAQAYLFQADKDKHRGRTRYRLAFSRQQCRLIE